MDFTEQLRVLEAAQGDPAKLALAAVDLAYPTLAEAERAELKKSLEAAAITHWCDEAILAILLELSVEESAIRLDRLRRLGVVEPFPARGSNAVNVHEASRLALRKAMADDLDGRFRTLSARAVTYFQDDHTTAGRTEWIYHLLCADPELGATQLEILDREWANQARPEERAALATALKEVDETIQVAGRARVWVLLAMAWGRTGRGEDAQLRDVAVEALELARSVGDARAQGDSQSLLGRVLVAQGNLAEALTAYRENLSISKRLVEQDPSNVGWLRELAVAHVQLGSVLQMQGNLEAAKSEYLDSLEICRRLAAKDPRHAVWQYDLAVAHNRVGGMLEAVGDLAGARAAFEAALAISRSLAAQDPGNAGWRSTLAAAHSWVGGVLQAQGDLAGARAAFEAALVISRSLAAQDPGNAGWRSTLAAVHSSVGGVLQAQGDLAGARAAFEAALAISRSLAAQDPSNADRQSALAIACVSVARLHFHAGRHSAALPLYEEANAILDAFRDRLPPSANWAAIKETVESELALCLSQVEEDGRSQTSTSTGQDT